ncbi:MAG: YciI family protein [Chryseolinea sp.]
MEEYIILMRLDLITKEAQPSPEQLQGYMLQYHAWIDGIVAAGKFVVGKGLSTEGKVIRFGKAITDGPFVEVKESIAGFISIRASDFDDATTIAAACPILNGKGTSVELRRIVNREQR